MFELDHALAQEIVDRAMAILPCNVNVMDSQGLILGSGEPARIDTRHEGAQLVLANGRMVELDRQAAACLKGVQPGVNLPLLLDQRLIGVLGVTGEPEQVRLYAELVRMTAEMLVAQRQQQAARQWRQQRREQWLELLLDGAGDTAPLFEEGRQMGLKPQLSRSVWLLEAEPMVDRDALAAWLSQQFADSWCLAGSGNSLFWCRSSAAAMDPARLLQRLAAQGWPLVRLALAAPASDLDGLRRDARWLVDVLAYGREVLPEAPLLALERHRLPSLLWRQRGERALDAWTLPLQRVQARDPTGQLIATLRAWCAHDGQSQACADALGIHRNSLRYRMERIAEASGFDPTTLDGMLALYLGVQLLPMPVAT